MNFENTISQFVEDNLFFTMEKRVPRNLIQLDTQCSMETNSILIHCP